MKVGVLELLTGVVAGKPAGRLSRYVMTRQYASVAPQAVAAWCRRRGHRTHYATYWGQTARPETLLPDDLDVVFIACHSTGGALAGALARLFADEGVRTVLGGPHARAFPDDALRFFDHVVLDCDETLVGELLDGHHPRGTVVTAGRPLTEIPPLEERLPDIAATAFRGGRPGRTTTIPLLASLGCPYSCDFCIDGERPYAELPGSALREDLAFLARELPGVRLSFHDPNFAVRFDAVIDLLEEVPAGLRSPYVMQASMSILKPDRMERLERTRCVYAAPSVESFNDYSDKAGVGRSTVGEAKLGALVAQFEQLGRHVPGIQVNFIHGLDADDAGSVERVRRFAAALPQVFCTVTVATPYGGTPFYERLRRQGRVLTGLPFVFYGLPWAAIVPRDGDVLAFYDGLVELLQATIAAGVASRFKVPLPASVRAVYALRHAHARSLLRAVRRFRSELARDAELLRFHEGQGNGLPRAYRARYLRRLGPYLEWIGDDELRPRHPAPSPPAHVAEPRAVLGS